MLIKQLSGSNAGMITDVEPDVGQLRVDSGSYEALPEEQWDDPKIVALVGKYPNAAPANPTAYVTSNGPDGYKIEPISELGGSGWYVRSRSGVMLNYRPMPNRPAAIDLAERHRSGTANVRAVIEAQAVKDKADHEELQSAEDARRLAAARKAGF